MSSTRTADVLVAGAGPGGCAVAANLVRIGVEVLLIHDGSGTSWPGESLPPGANGIVTSIFGDRPLANPRHRVAYGNRSAWGSAELLATDFLFHPLGTGWHLDRAVFDADLRACARELGAGIVEGARVLGAQRDAESWRVALDDGSVAACRVLVDATGRGATLARQQGSRRVRLDRQVALVGVFDNVAEEDSTTLVESVENGWWYASPLVGERRVVAFLTDGDLLPPVALHEESWREALGRTTYISATVAGGKWTGRLVASPAETSYLDHLFGPGWLAVGDAAMAWDPLSSQGIATAILMGGRAAERIAAGLGDGDTESLRLWESDYRELLRSHCEERHDFALAEDRWPESPFWTRRVDQEFERPSENHAGAGTFL
jgi:flavin-dependent dehydrogenase